MSDTPPTLPPNQVAPTDDLPEGYQPPLVAGGLFVDPNWAPRLADRLGSVRTDMGGVPEHWPQDLVPVMYPHLPNGFWREVPVEVLSLASISPSNGPVAGGTSVTLTGTGFVDIVAINWEIATYSPSDFVVVDSEHITCLSPAAPGAGSVDVEVVNANDDVGRLPSGFTYNASAPTLTSVSPNSGSTAGGTPVVITGTRLTNATSILFQANAATALVVVNDTTINCTSPAGSAGSVQVTMTNPDGNANIPGGFTYVAPPPAPTISTIVPNIGSTAGGDALVITGGNFVSGMSATIDGVLVTNGQYINPMRFECTSPPGAAGAVDVMVTTVGGTATLPGGYTYQAPVTVTVTGVSPATGLEAGGDGVTITGTGFVGVDPTTGVMFGPNAATGFVPDSPTQFTCLTPPGTGVVDVSVTATAGTGTLPGSFTYTASADDVTPQSSEPDPDVQQVAQTIQENAETIGEAAQNIGEAAQSLTEPSGADPASSPTSEAPSASEGTTEAPVTGQEPDMTEYEMDQLWGIEPAQGSTPEPASSS